MTNRERDVLILKEVFGEDLEGFEWPENFGQSSDAMVKLDGNTAVTWKDIPMFHEDWIAMQSLIDKLSQRHFTVELKRGPYKGDYTASVHYQFFGTKIHIKITRDVAPEAVALAGFLATRAFENYTEMVTSSYER